MRIVPRLLVLVASSGCHLVVGADDFQLATSGAGGTAAQGPGGSGGESTTGGGGGAAQLVSNGLIVRYYVDEAASGTEPSQLQDAAAQPLPLSLIYVTDLAFIEVEGNRALSWASVGNDSRATVAIDGTKIHSTLDGLRTSTVEVVLEVMDVTTMGSRFSHIGAGQEAGRFTLAARDVNAVGFWLNDGVQVGHWPFDLVGRARTVLHAVFDSTRPADADRLKLYADGYLVGGNEQPALPVDTVINLGPGCHYALGNRGDGQRSFHGRLYYGALYAAAFSASEVEHNAAILAVDDDGP